MKKTTSKQASASLSVAAIPEKTLREMLRAVICEVDYDISKFYDPELSEDPDEAEASMKRLLKIAQKYLP